MIKKIKVTVNYPWPGIEKDEGIIEFEENKNIDDHIGRIAFDYALDMIFDRGIDWGYEEIN